MGNFKQGTQRRPPKADIGRKIIKDMRKQAIWIYVGNKSKENKQPM